MGCFQGAVEVVPTAQALKENGAGDGIRTRDILLGKQVLYH